MHVLAGESALRALRAVRYRDLPIYVQTPELDEPSVLLPSQEPDDLVPPTREEDSFASEETLEDAGFAFEQVETNAHVDLWRLGNIGGFTSAQPLELVSFQRNRRVRQKRSRSRMLPRTLPASALVRVDPNLYFVCPELIVLQMAGSLSLMALVQLIMELCGSYALEPTGGNRRQCNYHVSPVTTISRIRAYHAHVLTRGCSDKIQQALKLAMEGAASPAETNLALMLSLPPDMGGYGFPQPQLNAKLTVADEERNNVSHDYYKLDLFWQDAYTALEYESDEFHLSPEAAMSFVSLRDKGAPQDPAIIAQRYAYIAKAASDRCRVRDVQYLGINVIPVVSFDLQSVRRMDQVARSLARNFERNAMLDMSAWLETLDEFPFWQRRHRLLRELRASTEELDAWSILAR
ncbi:MAG: hypothetical protein Q4B54_00080 [Coriobacteriales bacterium]|nr:hypothetical protein [Coriobacteriales bacterium]